MNIQEIEFDNSNTKLLISEQNGSEKLVVLEKLIFDPNKLKNIHLNYLKVKHMIQFDSNYETDFQIESFYSFQTMEINGGLKLIEFQPNFSIYGSGIVNKFEKGVNKGVDFEYNYLGKILTDIHQFGRICKAKFVLGEFNLNWRDKKEYFSYESMNLPPEKIGEKFPIYPKLYTKL